MSLLSSRSSKLSSLPTAAVSRIAGEQYYDWIKKQVQRKLTSLSSACLVSLDAMFREASLILRAKRLDRAISEPLSQRIDDLARRIRFKVDRTVRDELSKTSSFRRAPACNRLSLPIVVYCFLFWHCGRNNGREKLRAAFLSHYFSLSPKK